MFKWFTEEKIVCSTHVEMFLPSRHPCRQRRSLLHACGDVSEIYQSLKHNQNVCSTHVEMFLDPEDPRVEIGSLLHACGDVSAMRIPTHIAARFAPRMWRYCIHKLLC